MPSSPAQLLQSTTLTPLPSPSLTSTSPPASPENAVKKSNTPALAGGIIGALAFLFVLAILVYLLVLRKNRYATSFQHSPDQNPPKRRPRRKDGQNTSIDMSGEGKGEVAGVGIEKSFVAMKEKDFKEMDGGGWRVGRRNPLGMNEAGFNRVRVQERHDGSMMRGENGWLQGRDGLGWGSRMQGDGVSMMLPEVNQSSIFDDEMLPNIDLDKEGKGQGEREGERKFRKEGDGGGMIANVERYGGTIRHVQNHEDEEENDDDDDDENGEKEGRRRAKLNDETGNHSIEAIGGHEVNDIDIPFPPPVRHELDAGDIRPNERMV